jgi:hypothetical protein
MLTLEVAACFSLIASAFGGLVYALWPSRKKMPKAEPVSASQAVLQVEALPHFKGYSLAPKIMTKVIPETQEHQLEIMNAGLITHPDHVHCISAQYIIAYKDTFPKNISTHEAYLRGLKWEDYPWKEIIAKFGVIRVTGISGDALGCRLEARIRKTKEFGKLIFAPNWYLAGYLKWYLPNDPNNVEKHFDDIYQRREWGLNDYLGKTNEDIHPGDEKCLRVFYMMKDIRTVFLCTDVDMVNAGICTEDNPVEFELEVTVTAQHYSKTTNRFLVTAKWDDFTFVKM